MSPQVSHFKSIGMFGASANRICCSNSAFALQISFCALEVYFLLLSGSFFSRCIYHFFGRLLHIFLDFYLDVLAELFLFIIPDIPFCLAIIRSLFDVTRCRFLDTTALEQKSQHSWLCLGISHSHRRCQGAGPFGDCFNSIQVSVNSELKFQRTNVLC